MSIFTIGYEGAEIAAFIQALHQAGVQTVADVRAVAVSRRKGFSKTALANHLNAAGIGYVHFRDLGDPKPGREAAREGRMREFESIYNAHMNTAAAQAQLTELAQLSVDGEVALLCYEADALGCHRTMIARSIAKSKKMAIVNLNVNTQSAKVVRSRTHDHSCQGLAAA
ncbi:MAG: DUF488 family protein [Brevundimonas sp.]